MASPALSAAVRRAKVVTASLTVPAPPRRRAAKGRPLVRAMLLSPVFRGSLAREFDATKAHLADLGLTSEDHLRRVIVRAHLRLGKSKVTATDWVGRVFEIIGPDLPEVMRIESTVITEFLGLVNRYVLQNAAGFSFVNGYGVASRVRKQFNRPPEVIHNVRIRRPGQPTGSDYVDRGHLNRNADDQALFVSSEYKTRGAAGDLTPQTSRRDERLFGVPHPPGTELVYQMKGRSGTSSIDLDDIILASGKHSPAILREAAVFSRIGVRAGTRFGARVAKDQHGDPYIRIVVPCATDPMRRLLEKLLRDRTWQK